MSDFWLGPAHLRYCVLRLWVACQSLVSQFDSSHPTWVDKEGTAHNFWGCQVQLHHFSPGDFNTMGKPRLLPWFLGVWFLGLWGARAGGEFSRGHSPRKDSHPWEHHLDQARDCKLETLWLGSSHWCVLFIQHLTKSISMLSTVTLSSLPTPALDSTCFTLYIQHLPGPQSHLSLPSKGKAMLSPLQGSWEVSVEWWVRKPATVYSVQCSADRSLAASPRPGESWWQTWAQAGQSWHREGQEAWGLMGGRGCSQRGFLEEGELGAWASKEGR